MSVPIKKYIQEELEKIEQNLVEIWNPVYLYGRRDELNHILDRINSGEISIGEEKK